MKVLVVYDGLQRVESRPDGSTASGDWWRPGSDYDVIRVHFRKNAPSAVGGRVIGYEASSEPGRTVVIFAADEQQVGRAWPDDGVRQNGCRALDE